MKNSGSDHCSQDLVKEHAASKVHRKFDPDGQKMGVENITDVNLPAAMLPFCGRINTA